jgi:cytochrome P450
MWISHTIVRPLPFSFLFARFLVINLLLCFLTEEKIGAPKGSTTINIFSECTKAGSFLPFGSRSRACVGQKFVVLAISMLIASLLRSYEVKCTCSFSL